MSKDKDNGVDKRAMINLTTEIVSAYVGNNPVQSSELSSLIQSVHDSLEKLLEANEPQEEQKPAVSIRKSITDEYLICLEDGKKFKSLKRHLRSKYDMSPEEYREKWNLPYDYPMVAPAYARQRSQLAKKMGLGQAKK
ncbi:MAG: MucR family transcriptional regulator [Pseudomonadota bacterium]